MLNKLLKRCMPFMDKGRWYKLTINCDANMQLLDYKIPDSWTISQNESGITVNTKNNKLRGFPNLSCVRTYGSSLPMSENMAYEVAFYSDESVDNSALLIEIPSFYDAPGDKYTTVVDLFLEEY